MKQSSPKISYSNKNGLFYQRLMQREKNLSEEKAKLERAKQLLDQDYQEYKNAQNGQTETEPYYVDPDKYVHAQIDQPEAGEKSKFLQKFSIDLKFQVEKSEFELSELKRITPDKEKHQINLLEDKLKELKKLSQLVDNLTLKEEEVVKSEMSSFEHKTQLNETIKKKNSLEFQKGKILAKKEEIQTKFNEGEKMNKAFIDAQNELNETILKAEEEQKKYFQLNDELKQKKDNLEKQMNEFEQRAKSLKAKKDKREQIQSERKRNYENKMNEYKNLTEEYSNKIEEIEMQLENTENKFKEEKNKFETKNRLDTLTLQNKINELKQNNNLLQNKINEIGRNDQNIINLQKSNKVIKNQNAIKKAQIEKIKNQIFGEEQVPLMEENMQKEYRRIINLEREINNYASKLMKEENEIETEEETLNQKFDELKSEEKMLRIRKINAERFYASFKDQYEAQLKRYKILNSHINQE
ncbi:hypothetical protein GPJ56_004898 [Histomonas meleagridis]|uniref:uncharacterized protein n=1 Tax=Histomonas meleagridis TaxID=135588 RepID=UPI0035594623|nr:hypothetical protein GPJ56_004898 [Histomonas meleagridis]KAH0806563.1 hypothetical protein GO595_000725 [Histomonas meleagridis]